MGHGTVRDRRGPWGERHRLFWYRFYLPVFCGDWAPLTSAHHGSQGNCCLHAQAGGFIGDLGTGHLADSPAAQKDPWTLKDMKLCSGILQTSGKTRLGLGYRTNHQTSTGETCQNRPVAKHWLQAPLGLRWTMWFARVWQRSRVNHLTDMKKKGPIPLQAYSPKKTNDSINTATRFPCFSIVGDSV